MALKKTAIYRHETRKSYSEFMASDRYLAHYRKFYL